MLNKTYSLRPYCVSCWTAYILQDDTRSLQCQDNFNELRHVCWNCNFKITGFVVLAVSQNDSMPFGVDPFNYDYIKAYFVNMSVTE